MKFIPKFQKGKQLPAVAPFLQKKNMNPLEFFDAVRDTYAAQIKTQPKLKDPAKKTPSQQAPTKQRQQEPKKQQRYSEFTPPEFLTL